MDMQEWHSGDDSREIAGSCHFLMDEIHCLRCLSNRLEFLTMTMTTWDYLSSPRMGGICECRASNQRHLWMPSIQPEGESPLALVIGIIEGSRSPTGLLVGHTNSRMWLRKWWGAKPFLGWILTHRGASKSPRHWDVLILRGWYLLGWLHLE